jgi:hypothetical protein
VGRGTQNLNMHPITWPNEHRLLEALASDKATSNQPREVARSAVLGEGEG